MISIKIQRTGFITTIIFFLLYLLVGKLPPFTNIRTGWSKKYGLKLSWNIYKASTYNRNLTVRKHFVVFRYLPFDLDLKVAYSQQVLSFLSHLQKKCTKSLPINFQIRSKSWHWLAILTSVECESGVWISTYFVLFFGNRTRIKIPSEIYSPLTSPI